MAKAKHSIAARILCAAMVFLICVSFLPVSAKAASTASIYVDPSDNVTEFDARETIHFYVRIRKYSTSDTGNYYVNIYNESGNRVAYTSGSISNLSVGVTRIDTFWDYTSDPHAIGKYSVRYYTSHDTGGTEYFSVVHDEASFGSGLKYEMDRNGLLTISGSGAMPSFGYRDQPWRGQEDSVKEVVIEDGVTGIGEYCFHDFPNIQKVTIAGSVRSIGENAFSDDTGLQEVEIKSGTKIIGSWSFSDCTALSKLTLPSTVTSIEFAAFDGVYLDDIYYLGSQEQWNKIRIDNYNDCLSTANLHFEGFSWKLSNGVLTISGKGPMPDYDNESAPWDTEQVRSIVISDGVTSIGNSAFLSCAYATSVSIPTSVTSIGNSAFAWCSRLNTIDIPKNVTNIGDWSFVGCTGLTGINVDTNNTKYTSKDGVLFSKDMTQLICFPAKKSRAYQIPSGVTTIGLAAFNSSGITSVSIPDSVTEIGMQAFAWCKGLTSITIPKNVVTIDSFAFFEAGLKSIVFKSCPSIDDYAFADVTATVYYRSTDGWTSSNRKSFGGTLTWKLLQNGWNNLGGKWYYFVNGEEVTGWKQISSKWYYFDASGVMQTGWKQISGKWYYFDASGVMQTGWKQISGKWYYFNANGAMQTGFVKINSKTFYFNANGVWQKYVGWQQISGKWYYFNQDSVILTGWQQINSKWYYLGTDGAMQKGLLKINGKLYYFNDNGVWQKYVGWKQIDGKWYYFNQDSVAVTGWQQIKTKWYYFDTDGSMKTGWLERNGKKYYLDADGVMQTAWTQIDGQWYYFNAGGDMKTGWLQQGSTWYYFKADGVMACDETLTINGKTYTFSSTGAWIQ